MNITITSKKTVAREDFRQKAERKLSKLNRFFGDDANIVINLTNEREEEIVEIGAAERGLFFRVVKSAPDRLDALDMAVDSLFKQIVRHKTKLEKKFKSGAYDNFAESDLPAEDEHEASYEVLKKKSFVLKPMSVDEAILQMDMLNHQFFVFLNNETNRINVVYKRKSDSYGLIETETE